jgi:predicted O-methyltransferase YrrM
MAVFYYSPMKNRFIRKKKIAFARSLGKDSHMFSKVRNWSAGRRHRAIAAWCAEHAIPLNVHAESLSADLWTETTTYSKSLARELSPRISAMGLDPARFPWSAEFGFLYFLVRYLKPDAVVETGVSLGWSSRAILDAMHVNGQGTLYSSDILVDTGGPDFVGDRVGSLVDDRSRWRLYLKGDRENLPRILAETQVVDLFHYDSDKSPEGRNFALNLVEPRLNKRSVVVVDDIKDNWHWRDWSAKSEHTLVLSKDVALSRGIQAWIGIAGESVSGRHPK